MYYHNSWFPLAQFSAMGKYVVGEVQRNTGEESYWYNEENMAADVGDNEQEISIDNETDDAPVFSIFDIANILAIFKLKENVSRSGMDSLLALLRVLRVTNVPKKYMTPKRL
ncbi:unnamed protein product [Didymodactylos carnosus]|uniref:Uncharacterized protein n=1 Tax=Didymodactylos carnosus TaxID=1234261 RepID=A0A813TVV9_9BILA|nr:unnamed protein product [Didymodactylos carnosus]CAF3600726.1 unnamed protein product [Didymodactylos carnosus]